MARVFWSIAIGYRPHRAPEAAIVHVLSLVRDAVFRELRGVERCCKKRSVGGWKLRPVKMYETIVLVKLRVNASKDVALSDLPVAGGENKLVGPVVRQPWQSYSRLLRQDSSLALIGPV